METANRNVFLGVLLSIAAAVILFSAARGDTPVPKPAGRISDFARVIDDTNHTRIAQVVSDLEARTTAEMAVVTIDSLQGESVEEYANRLFNEWGIGKKGKDNGVLLLVAVSDRKLRIEVGYSLEGVVPDGFAGDVIRNTIVPYFKQGRFGDGIYAGALRLAQRIEGEEETAPPELQPPPMPSTEIPGPSPGAFLFRMAMTFIFGFGLVVVVVVIIAAIAIAAYRRARKCPRCGQWMRIEDEMLREASCWKTGQRRRERTCPACGFHDVHTYVIPRRSMYYSSGGWGGAGGGGGFSGGGGGFGGGSSGGGGASGSW